MNRRQSKLVDRHFVIEMCQALEIDPTNVTGIAIHAGVTGRDYVKVYVYMQGDERLLEIAKKALENAQEP